MQRQQALEAQAAERASEKKQRATAAAQEAKDVQAAKESQAAKLSRARELRDLAERAKRLSLVRSMEESITKDAKRDVADGLLNGPILYTTCTALGGGSSDDLTAMTGTFTCLAASKENGDGTTSGFSFSATANWDDQSYTWHLGN